MAEFPLEVRIFHSLCILVIIALAYNVPFNYAIGLPLIALLSLVTLIVFSFLYHRSRYQGKIRSTMIIFTVIGNLLFLINFILNSGTHGPTALLMGLCIFLILCVVPKSQQRFWMFLNLTIILACNWLEYFRPEFIPNTYKNRSDRYWDISSAYLEW